MKAFEYWNPVKILFGLNTIENLSTQIPRQEKILVLYGGGSIHKNGVYKQVKNALEGHRWDEFGGIEANPTLETCLKAVDLIKKESFSFLLAVGGGSVIDASKFIAAAVFSKRPHKILAGAKISQALPIGAVLTLPATGSEMNCFSVISVKSAGEKLSFGSPLVYPKFSIIDPQTHLSLPLRQLRNGVVDSFVHVMEQYMTYPCGAEVQDRQAEGLLASLMDLGPKIIADQENIELRSNLAWAATCALNGLIGVGVPHDWATHRIGHELTAIYGLDHAQTLAIVLPKVWCHQKAHKKEKLKQFGERVLKIPTASLNLEDYAARVIDQTIAFFHSLGVKTQLQDFNIEPEEAARLIGERFRRSKVKIGERQSMGANEIEEILMLSSRI